MSPQLKGVGTLPCEKKNARESTTPGTHDKHSIFLNARRLPYISCVLVWFVASSRAKRSTMRKWVFPARLQDTDDLKQRMRCMNSAVWITTKVILTIIWRYISRLWCAQLTLRIKVAWGVRWAKSSPLTATPGTLQYNGTGNSTHYCLAYADFRSGAWTGAAAKKWH